MQVTCPQCDRTIGMTPAAVIHREGLCANCFCKNNQKHKCLDCDVMVSTPKTKRCWVCSGARKRGVPKSPRHRRNSRAALPRGPNHHNWKGGTTPERNRLMATPEYKAWRTSVFERDNYTCQECGDRSRAGHAVILHADHIEPYCTHKHLALNLDNGRTLCADCHRLTPTYGVNMVNQMARP